MTFKIGPFRIGFDAPAPTPPVAAEVKVDAKAAEPAKTEENKQINEFYKIGSEFISNDIAAFTEKYPLISTISIIAFGFFGLINVLSLFSPTSILTGIFFGTLSISLARSTWNIHGTSIFGKVWSSFRAAFIDSAPPAKAEEPAPAATAPATGTVPAPAK